MRCRKVREGPRPCGAVPEARGCAVARPFARMSGGGAAVGKGSLPGLVYGTFLGGVASDTNYGVGVDASENAIVTGQTFSSNFPVTEGAFQTHYGGGLIFDAFVAKVRTAGGVTPAVVGSSGGGDAVDGAPSRCGSSDVSEAQTLSGFGDIPERAGSLPVRSFVF
jgi:hypothetical protein